MYKILAEVDLSNYFLYGKSWLYDILNDLHKEVYEDNERIIFYLNQPDIYEYSDNINKGEIETQLDYLLKEIDIPEYFVIKKFSKEKDIIPLQSDIKCVVPWIRFQINPNGDVTPCCLIKENFGNIDDFKNITEAINSVKHKNLRLDMVKNKKNRACKTCYEQEKNGIKSERLSYNKSYKKYELEKIFNSTKEDGSIETYPTTISLGLDNICNFKCRMCYHGYSSRIEDEDIKLGLLKNKNIKMKDIESYENFINDITQLNIKNINKLSFWGGEPLLHNDHYLILDKLIENKNLNLTLKYHTNLNLLNYKKKSIIDYWNKFENVVVYVSIEALGKKGEYIRSGANNQQIINNIIKLKKECSHAKIYITTTFTIYNALCITDLHKELFNKKIINFDNMNVNPAIGDLNDVRILPTSVKRQVELKINDFLEYISNFKNTKTLMSQYKNLIKYMYSTDYSYKLPSFIDQVLLRDKIRKEDFFEIFPELIDIKNYL